MYFEIFGLVVMTRNELDNLTQTFMSIGKKQLDEQKKLLEDRHDAELDRLERVTDSHHDTLKKALNYMMTALGGVPMEDPDDRLDNRPTVERDYTFGIQGNATVHGIEYSAQYKHLNKEQERVADLDLSRDASKLIPDLEAELKRLRDAQKSTHETDPTNDMHIQAQDQYDLDGTGINDVLGIWGSAIASVQDSKTNPGVQSE